MKRVFTFTFLFHYLNTEKSFNILKQNFIFISGLDKASQQNTKFGSNTITLNCLIFNIGPSIELKDDDLTDAEAQFFLKFNNIKSITYNLPFSEYYGIWNETIKEESKKIHSIASMSENKLNILRISESYNKNIVCMVTEKDTDATGELTTINIKCSGVYLDLSSKSKHNGMTTIKYSFTIILKDNIYSIVLHTVTGLRFSMYKWDEEKSCLGSIDELYRKLAGKNTEQEFPKECLPEKPSSPLMVAIIVLFIICIVTTGILVTLILIKHFKLKNK